jgi:hypothetical protein
MPPLFFEQKATLDAILGINDHRNIVIYCGAGVTIDQTGLSWSALIRGVFRVGQSVAGASRETKSIEFLLEQFQDPRQTASIVVEAFLTSAQSENEFLGSTLRSLLYGNDPRAQGLILRNVAFLAVSAALLERNVTIITTNYDDFIETKISNRTTRQLNSAGEKAEDSPAVIRRTLHTDTGPKSTTVHEAEGSGGTIEVVYLHGRVPRSGDVDGDVVLTERSYAKTREQSQQVLHDAFTATSEEDEPAVLIVGASLTDGPLVDALAMTRDRSAAQRRVALIDLPLSPKQLASSFRSDNSVPVDVDDVRAAIGLRGKHLGVDILWPSTHAQTAQFLEELRIDLEQRIASGDEKAYTAPANQATYGRRLKTWSTDFSSGRARTDPEYVYDLLQLITQAAVGHLEDAGRPLGDEHVRTELWARAQPSSRKLTLIGTSAGPLRDVALQRTESVTSRNNASIRGFQEGRPVLVDLGELELQSAASRWKTFLSVPIFTHVDAANGSPGGRIPVGVLTLTTTKSMRAEDAAARSVFQELPLKPFAAIVGDIIGIGQQLLNPYVPQEEDDSEASEG